MSKPAWIWRSEYVVPSQSGAGCDAIHEVVKMLAQHEWKDNDIFSVQLAMEEAIVNAVKHGNLLDESKMVRIDCALAEDLIHIEVTDEGSGFDPESLPDPTEECHREIPGGRGVMLMRNFMTRVDYNTAGNQVVMEKRRGG